MRAQIVILGLIILLMLGSVLPILGNSWDTIFKAMGYELMCLKMDDGKILKFTTYHKDKVDRKDLFRFIRDEGYKPSQIEVCIHNHPMGHGQNQFSANDKKLYEQMGRHGFKGEFLLYCRGKIYELKEK